ncbi:hypothetical protein SAY87_031099 [Trapa incisa]|uniref:Uncharacterized protein n=1 Tax=Trapa incisa TaxID=236973 RepID=A0AAN7QKF7_9MYRT|nr:hypothetical protein SAY87_031099 [Trapa incisa]
MEAWMDREHYNIGVLASPACHRHLLHSCSLALPLLLYQLQQADGEDGDRHESVPLRPPCATDLPCPVDLSKGSEFLISTLGMKATVELFYCLPC